MNLLYKLLPDFLKKLFFPAIYFEDEDIVFDTRYLFKPCAGSLKVKDYCKGCYFEEDHT